MSQLNAVMDSPALREAYEQALPVLTDYFTDLSHNERLFERFKALRDYRLAGVDLPADQKASFKAIQQELAALSNRFERNVLDATESPP